MDPERQRTPPDRIAFRNLWAVWMRAGVLWHSGHGPEIRCHMRYPDGYMIEVSQSTGLLSAPNCMGSESVRKEL